MAPLVDLDTLKLFLNIPVTDTTSDERLEFVLEAASEAVSDYSDRDFTLQEASAVATERLYPYDGTGWLDIDDCTNIESVKIGTRLLVPEDWSAHPINEEVSYYLKLYGGAYGYESPAMGFKWNADKTPMNAIKPINVAVVAKWGWPEVPFSVKQATLWTAIALNENPKPYLSESIEGYSRTVGEAPAYYVPPRAQAALARFVRIKA